jgi:predicted nuclease with RNAse H fold
MGIGVFWCLLPSMSAMTLRGIALARTFRASGILVIESYPGGAQDLLGIPRKRANFEELKRGLQRAGIEGDFVDRKVSHDEIDAITAALVGLFYLADEVVALGNALEDYLILPRSSRIDYPRLGAILERTGLDPLQAVS